MMKPSIRRGQSDLASGAFEVIGPCADAEPALQHDLVLSPAIEALLADVVIRLRESWISGPAQCWGAIHPICKLAVGQSEKRVAVALCEGFSQFSQFLCGLEVLLLQREKGSAEFEQTLLSVEKLFVHGPNYFLRLGIVPEGNRAPAERDGGVDRSESSADERQVHASSLELGVGDENATDSTATKVQIGPIDVS